MAMKTRDFCNMSSEDMDLRKLRILKMSGILKNKSENETWVDDIERHSLFGYRSFEEKNNTIIIRWYRAVNPDDLIREDYYVDEIICESLWYYTNGSLWAIDEYKDGTLSQSRVYGSGGILKYETVYKDGKMQEYRHNLDVHW